MWLAEKQLKSFELDPPNSTRKGNWVINQLTGVTYCLSERITFGTINHFMVIVNAINELRNQEYIKIPLRLTPLNLIDFYFATSSIIVYIVYIHSYINK